MGQIATIATHRLTAKYRWLVRAQTPGEGCGLQNDRDYIMGQIAIIERSRLKALDIETAQRTNNADFTRKVQHQLPSCNDH